MKLAPALILPPAPPVQTLAYRPLGLRCKNTHPTALSDGINTYGIYRCRHKVAAAGSGDMWKLAFANRSAETASTNAITVSCDIEYPSGTFTTITFSSSSSLTISAGGADVFSDGIPLSMPAGAVFYTRTLVSVATVGQKWPTMDVLSFASANGESATLGTGVLPPITGALTPSNATAVYGPVVILGRTACPVGVVLVGDSITSGNGDDQTRFDIGYISRGLGLQWPILCVATSGELASGSGTGFAANHANRIALIKQCGITHAIVNYGNNDIGSSVGATTIQNALQKIYNLLSSLGITVIIGTIGPRATSSDHFVTLTAQTVTAGFTIGGTVDTVNTWILNKPSPAVLVYDINTAFRDAGTYKWRVNNTTVDWSCLDDGIHPSPNAGTGHPQAGVQLYPIICILPAASPPTPLIFGQASADWDAENLSLTNGTSVSSWPDRIKGLVAGGASNLPTYVTGATPEGRPVVRFASASSQALTIAANAQISNVWTQGGYALFAIRPNSIGATNGDVYSKSTTNRLCMNSTAQMNFEPQFSTTSPTFLITTPTAGAAAWIVMSIAYNPATPNAATVMVNGTTSSPTGTSGGTILDDSAATMVLGNRTDLARGFDGDIMRITFWKVAPTAAQQIQAYNWLRGRLGV